MFDWIWELNRGRWGSIPQIWGDSERNERQRAEALWGGLCPTKLPLISTKTKLRSNDLSFVLRE